MVLTGTVKDARTREPLAFASVNVLGQRVGTKTDDEGLYRIKIKQHADSLVVRIVGYKRLSKAIPFGKKKEIVIDFELEPSSALISEVKVKAGENPAFRILRGVWANKEINTKKSLQGYEYEAYTRAEIAMDRLAPYVASSQIGKPLQEAFDSLKYQPDGEDRPKLPVFYSENISKCYYSQQSIFGKEVVEGAKVEGIGVEDGSFVTQLMGNTYRDYDFYSGWVQILEKQFISPLSEMGRLYYEYYLTDSFYEAGLKYYKLRMKPKREKDLVFQGYMIIQDSTFALVKINAETLEAANINYVDKLRVEQENIPTGLGPWIPNHVRLWIDFGDVVEAFFGATARFDCSMRGFVYNKPKPNKFFDRLVEMDELATDRDEDWWKRRRHHPLLGAEKEIYQVVLGVCEYPSVKVLAEMLKLAFTGFYRRGKIDYGPWLFVFGRNSTEGPRLRMGIRTNHFFSKRWILSAYGAYGFKDERFKWFLMAERFLNRRNWTRLGLQIKYDVEGIGIDQSFLADNRVASVSTQAFAAAAQLGALNRLTYTRAGRLWIESDLARNLNLKAAINFRHNEPAGFVFKWIRDNDPENANPKSKRLNDHWRTADLAIDLRYAPGEELLVNGNDRGVVRRNFAPIFGLNYTLGLKGLLGSDFNYQKFSFNLAKNFRMGLLGWGEYSLTASAVLNPLPYPLLEVQPGNETFLRFRNVFNMMNFFELVSDRSLTLRGFHHFEGLLINAIPLLKRLDLRLVAGGAICWGGFRDENNRYLPANDEQGRPLASFNPLKDDKLYAEVSYGFENVFKVLRIEAFHRLSYLDVPGAPKFRIKISTAFGF